jgi:FixJ family two-component response regulator
LALSRKGGPEIEPVVLVVDDERQDRELFERLIRSAGFKAQTFGSAAEFLLNPRPDAPACLVLEVLLPGLSGFDLQRELTRRGIDIPIIFVTGHGDISTAVQAMKAGAVDFLTKPCGAALLKAIRNALERDRAARKARADLDQLQQRYQSLTPSERKVMAGVVSGLLNKEIAIQNDTSEKTVKFHRGHVMHKMQARSLADLVRMAVQCDTGPKSSSIPLA